jgi:hypothetical protein
MARNGRGGAVTAVCCLGQRGRHLLGMSISHCDPTETSSGIGPPINLKSAQALGIDIPAALLARTGACSLDGLHAQAHYTVSAFTGRVN